MESSYYARHDSQNCECCLDFWGAPEPQPKEKDVESDADSGYCSITRKDAQYTQPAVRAETPLIPPRIIVTPLSDDEQIQHNACIRASLLQRNAFATITQEEKALPSTAARSTVSLPTTAATRPLLSPPEESWAHRLKDTYENRMMYPQYFDIVAPARKRPAKIVEKHPAAMVSTTQSVRKRWSIAGSGVGFGFGKDVDVKPVTLRQGPQATATVAPTVASVATPVAAAVDSKSTASSDSSSLKRRARVTSTRSLSDKLSDKSSRSSPSPPSPRPSSMILTSSSGNALGKWANSNTGGAFGKGVQGVKSFIGRYSNAPSSFRML